MKILIITLLSTIAFFIQFDELNAFHCTRTVGPLTPNVVPEANPRDGLDDHRPPDQRVLHEDTYISFWLDPRNRRTVVRADFATNIAPSQQFVASNDFHIKLTHIGDRSRNFTVVGYFWPERILFGVRAPNPYAYARPFLEPTTSQWFIIHCGRAFRVGTNPRNAEVESVSLLPANLHENFGNRNILQRTLHWVADVPFWVIRGPEGELLGAEYAQDPSALHINRH